MKGRTVAVVGIAFLGLLTLITAVGVFRGSSVQTAVGGLTVSGLAFQLDYTPSVRYLTATTNSAGRFDVAHGISGSHWIVGVTVSIQSKVNKSWYTPGASSNISSVLAWNATTVSGSIGHPDFAGQPARILVFHIPAIK
jgi:hypothetical protein